MKHLKNLVLFVLLASAQFAYSDEACDACDPCYMGTECDLCNISLCDMEFELYADALYWHNDLSLITNDGKTDHDYNWGWRIGASAYWNSWDIGFRYTSFSSTAKRDVQFGENAVVAASEFDYDVFDVELGRACCICEGILFRPFFGGKFARIKVDNRNIDQLTPDGKLKLDGCGLYVGFDNRWQICSFNVCDRSIPVALVSRFSTGVLDGDFKYSVEGEEGSAKDCQFIPVHELYAGLEFRMCGLCNADAFFQVGYEVQYWGWRGDRISRIPQAQAIGFVSDSLSHLGVGGLVLRLGANF